jgi:hypothetical protein
MQIQEIRTDYSPSTVGPVTPWPDDSTAADSSAGDSSGCDSSTFEAFAAFEGLAGRLGFAGGWVKDSSASHTSSSGIDL